MLLSKEALNRIDNEISEVIESYMEKINDNSKFTFKQRYMVSIVFSYRRVMAKYKFEHGKYNEEEVYRIFAEEMNWAKEKLKTYEIAERVSKAVIEGEAIIDLIGECADKIKEVYENNSKELYHISPEKGLKEINYSKNVLNQYKTETLDAVFALSGYDKGINYLMRSSAGGMIRVLGKYIIFPQNPFKTLDKKEGFNLKKESYVYSVKPDNFEPVINYYTDSGYFGRIVFDGEWISRNEKEEVIEGKRIDNVSRDIFDTRQIFVQTAPLDSIEKLTRTNDEEEIQNTLEMLIGEGELDYLNDVVEINTIERLKIAKERSSNRKKLARETLEKINSNKIEDYLDKNLQYTGKEIEMLREIEAEGPEDEKTAEEAENATNITKRLNKVLFSIDPILGIKGNICELKNRGMLSKIVEEKGEKEATRFVIDKIIAKNVSEDQRAVITNMVYSLTKSNDKSQAEEKNQIKDKSYILLDMVYLKAAGISEKSLYSFIIDICDDDLDVYTRKVETITNIVDTDRLSEVKIDVDSYITSRRLMQEVNMNPKEVKKIIKTLFTKEGKYIKQELKSSDNGNVRVINNKKNLLVSETAQERKTSTKETAIKGEKRKEDNDDIAF